MHSNGAITRVALKTGLSRNYDLLADLLSTHEVVEITDDVPEDTDLCIVDAEGFLAAEDALTAWKREQRPVYAPVVVLVDADTVEAWERSREVLDGSADAIQVIPAPKAAIRARVDTHLETRQYSLELEHERELTDHVFQTSPIGHVLLETDGTLVQANDRAETVLGLDSSSFEGPVFEASPWHLVDEAGEPLSPSERPLARVLDSEAAVYDAEYGIEYPDGTVRWLSVNMAPLFEDGAVAYVVGAIQDVTDQRTLQRQLRESEQLHRVTLENILDTVFLTDDSGQFTYVCPNVDHIFGYTEDEVREMGSIQALLGSDPTPEDFESGDVVENLDTVVTDTDGQDHDVLITIKSVSIQDGTRLFSIRDVTQLVETEAQLQEQRMRIDTLLAHTPLVMLSIDADGTIQVARGEQLVEIGMDPETLLGESIHDVLDHRPDLQDNVDRMLDGEAFSASVDLDDRTFETWYEPIYEDGVVDHGILVAQDVTERKRQQAELERQFDLFEKAQDIAAVGAWEYDVESDELWWTDRVADLHGLDPEATPTIAASFDQYHSADRSRVETGFRQAIEEGTSFDTEARLLDSDGRTRWVRVRGEPQYDGEDLLRVRGTMRDITERKSRLEQLRQYRQAVESSTDLLTAVDEDFEILFANEVYRSYHGLDQQSLRGRPLESVLGEAAFEEVKPRIEAALKGVVVQFEMTRIHPQKGERTLDVQYYPLRDEHGKTYGMVGAIRDITTRKAMELDLRANKERYESLFDSIRDAILVTDTDHTVVNCNTAFTDLFGYDLDEVEGESARQLYDSAQDFETIRGNIDAHINDPKFVQTVQYATKSGVSFPGETNVSYIRTPKGTTTGFISIIRDVSMREEQLQQLRAIDRILQHNYHNDMQVIQANAELLAESCDEDMAERAGKILTTSEALLHRVDNGRRIRKFLADQPELQTVDICTLVTHGVAEARERYPQATITFDSPQAVSAIGTTKLDAAVAELLDNAIEHAGHDAPTVDVQIRTVGDSVQIHVSDDGPGIPEMERAVVSGERELDPVYHGSGLGLWFVRLIVRHCHGGLSFGESDMGGSTVTMTLNAVQ